MEGMREQGLSGNALKVIAIVAMTIDHLAWMGIETYVQAETPLQIFLHSIGRLTAPIPSASKPSTSATSNPLRRTALETSTPASRRRSLTAPQTLSLGPSGLRPPAQAPETVPPPRLTPPVCRQKPPDRLSIKVSPESSRIQRGIQQ